MNSVILSLFENNAINKYPLSSQIETRQFIKQLLSNEITIETLSICSNIDQGKITSWLQDLGKTRTGNRLMKMLNGFVDNIINIEVTTSIEDQILKELEAIHLRINQENKNNSEFDAIVAKNYYISCNKIPKINILKYKRGIIFKNKKIVYQNNNESNEPKTFIMKSKVIHNKILENTDSIQIKKATNNSCCYKIKNFAENEKIENFFINITNKHFKNYENKNKKFFLIKLSNLDSERQENVKREILDELDSQENIQILENVQNMYIKENIKTLPTTNLVVSDINLSSNNKNMIISNKILIKQLDIKLNDELKNNPVRKEEFIDDSVIKLNTPINRIHTNYSLLYKKQNSKNQNETQFKHKLNINNINSEKANTLKIQEFNSDKTIKDMTSNFPTIFSHTKLLSNQNSSIKMDESHCAEIKMENKIKYETPIISCIKQKHMNLMGNVNIRINTDKSESDDANDQLSNTKKLIKRFNSFRTNESYLVINNTNLKKPHFENNSNKPFTILPSIKSNEITSTNNKENQTDDLNKENSKICTSNSKIINILPQIIRSASDITKVVHPRQDFQKSKPILINVENNLTNKIRENNYTSRTSEIIAKFNSIIQLQNEDSHGTRKDMKIKPQRTQSSVI